MNALHRTDGSVEWDLGAAAVDAGVLFLEALLDDEQLLGKFDLVVDALDGHVKVTECALVTPGELDDTSTVLAEAGDEPLEFGDAGHPRTLSGVTR